MRVQLGLKHKLDEKTYTKVDIIDDNILSEMNKMRQASYNEALIEDAMNAKKNNKDRIPYLHRLFDQDKPPESEQVEIDKNLQKMMDNVVKGVKAGPKSIDPIHVPERRIQSQETTGYEENRKNNPPSILKSSSKYLSPRNDQLHDSQKRITFIGNDDRLNNDRESKGDKNIRGALQKNPVEAPSKQEVDDVLGESFTDLINDL